MRVIEKRSFVPVVILAIWAGTFASAQPVVERKMGTVSGSVLSITGEPVRKAQVALNGADGASQMGYAATTDASGAFRLPDVEPGKYTLTVFRSGYAIQPYREGRGRLSYITVAAGSEVTGLMVKLTPHGVISGKVLDEDGDPVPECNVQILAQRYVRGKRQYQPSGGAQVNDLGEYRAANLPAGKYLISVNCRRLSPVIVRGRGGEESYAINFYPGTADLAQAVPVELKSGTDLRGMDVRLAKSRTFHVRGKVIDGTTGALAQNAFLTLVRTGGSGVIDVGPNVSGGLNAQGMFDIGNVLPGSYTLLAMRPNGEDRSTSQQPVEVGTRDVSDITLVISPGIAVSGSVKFEGGGALPAAGMAFVLEPVNSLPMNAPNFQLKADGTFIANNVGSGRFRVRAMNLPPGSYVKSLRMASREVTDSILDFTSGAAGPIDFLLSAKAGQINGTVQDSSQKPAPGVMVILVPEASKRDQFELFKVITSDQSGAFSSKNLPPGEYTLFSWEELEDGAWQDPDVLKKYEVDGTKVRLAEGSNETVQVKMIPRPQEPGGR